MAKKVFKSELFTDIKYEVTYEEWLDDDTYVVFFDDMTDDDGDTYHLEVEWHEDERRITYTRVYDYENVDAEKYIHYCFKKQIDEYILKQVGVLKGMLSKQKIAIELTLDVDPTMTIGELNEYLKTLRLEVVDTKAEKVKCLEVKNLGLTK